MKLEDCLGILRADGLVAHFGREQVTLCHGAPEEVHEQLIAEFEHVDRQARGASEAPIDICLGQGQYCGKRIKDAASSAVSYALLYYQKSSDDAKERAARAFHALVTAPTLFQVLQHRVRLFAPFPAEISQMYWYDCDWVKTDTRDRLRPPWELDEPLPTVTLGFDLRKSTFCMDNAAPRDFAKWLDNLTQILMTVAHSFGGVFDKFTGDGAIVHFLARETKKLRGEGAVVAAIQCAIAMSNATAYHIKRLREFLRLDSELLGGGIGIDIALAHWSLDHRHNPITVGRGVVTACRLMDSTPARAVRITNIAYRKLPAALQAAFHSISFKSKEYGEELRLRVWEIEDATRIRTAVDFKAVCEDVYRRSDYEVDGDL